MTKYINYLTIPINILICTKEEKNVKLFSRDVRSCECTFGNENKKGSKSNYSLKSVFSKNLTKIVHHLHDIFVKNTNKNKQAIL